MNKTTRLKKPQIPELDTLYEFDDLGGRPKYGGVEMTSETDIPSFQEIMDETHSAVVAEATARDDADEALEAEIQALAGQTSEALEDEAETRAAADTALREAINSEASTRGAADNVLQNQIDAIVASSDVKDIVGTKAELDAYDTSTLGDNDIIKVLQDESQSNATTYYRYAEATDSFTLIGSEGPYYTKGQADVLLNAKADKATTYTKTEVDATVSGLEADIAAKQNELTAGTGIDITNDVISVTSTGPTVVQTTGTSTTDVMSQNAVTGMVYADPSTRQTIRLGNGSSAHANAGIAIGSNATSSSSHAIAIKGTASGLNSITIGNGASAPTAGSIAIGSFSGGSAITEAGVMHIGSSNTTLGYNSSNYRLLAGLYDGQSAHDAATYGQVISYSAINGTGAPATATEGKYVGQLYYDTINENMYFLKAIDTTTDPATYTWETLGGGPTVVQTKGTSQTDVMSQNATTSMVFADPSTVQQVRIGNTSSSLVSGSVIIGRNAVNYANNGGGSAGPTVTIGNSATTYSADTIAIGGSAVAGYSPSNLTGAIAIGKSAQAGYGGSSGSSSIAIGTSAKASTGQGGGYGGIAIGASAQADNRSSIALGAYSKTSATGEMNIGSTSTSYGYNNSSYRLLTGLYDPQSAHDAATKGYVDTAVASAGGAAEINSTDWSNLWQ